MSIKSALTILFIFTLLGTGLVWWAYLHIHDSDPNLQNSQIENNLSQNDEKSEKSDINKKVSQDEIKLSPEDLKFKQEIEEIKQADIKNFGHVKPETTQKIIEVINQKQEEEYNNLSDEEKQQEFDRRKEIQDRVDAINAEMNKK